MTALALKPDSRSASDLADEAQSVVHDLRRRLAEAEREVAALPSKRAALAYKASQGDKRAQSRLDDLLAGETVTRAQVVTLQAALVEGARRLEAARADERTERDETDLATAQLLAVEFIAESARIDRALADIGAAHKRRAELRIKLAATGCIDNLSHLDCSIRMRLAVAHAGVFEILSAGANAPSRDDRVALATSDRRTLSDLQPRSMR